MLVAYCDGDGQRLNNAAPQWALVENEDNRIVTVHPERTAAFAVSEFNSGAWEIPNRTGFISNYEQFFRFEYAGQSAPTIFTGKALLDHPENQPFQYAHVVAPYLLLSLRKIFINTAFFKKIELRPEPD